MIADDRARRPKVGRYLEEPLDEPWTSTSRYGYGVDTDDRTRRERIIDAAVELIHIPILLAGSIGVIYLLTRIGIGTWVR